MKIIVISTVLLTLANAQVQLADVIFQGRSSLGKSHGGSKSDIEALSDGIGAMIKTFSGSSPVNLQKYHKLVFQNGEEAKKSEKTIYELTGLSPESLEKGEDFLAQIKSKIHPRPTGDPITRNKLEQRIIDWALNKSPENMDKVIHANTSQITDMSNLFSINNYDETIKESIKNFNLDISGWDVSNVTNMKNMFYHAEYFNQPIGAWNVSSVTDISGMFNAAYKFNQPIGSWNTSNVTNMSGLFYQATSFNQTIGDWDVSNVTNMIATFAGALKFNQPIGKWDVSHVADMTYMFRLATKFNQNISKWDVSNVTGMGSLFYGAKEFNQPIGSWNVANVQTMFDMFYQADTFNQPIGNWDTSAVTSMKQMFYGADNFNQPVNNWNVSSVTNHDNFRTDSALTPENSPF